MSRVKAKKISKIALDVVTYIFLALCIFTVVVTVLSKRDVDGAAEIFGYQMRVVTSDSMAECELTDVSSFKIKDIPVRSMIFVKVMPDDPAKADQWYRDVREGDVLTFRYVYNTQVTITHRVVTVNEKETGGFVIDLVGDNKNSESDQLYQSIDTSIPNNPNYVIGKVVGQSYVLGVVMSFLRQPLAIALLIILPCFIIIMMEVAKIVKVLSADKKKRDEEEMAKKEDELEELRRRLAELEAQKQSSAEAPAESPTESPAESPAESPTGSPTGSPVEAPTEADGETESENKNENNSDSEQGGEA